MKSLVSPAAMLAALLTNWLGHRTGRWPTLCTTWRRHLPGWAFIAFWAGITGWLVKHLLDGYER